MEAQLRLGLQVNSTDSDYSRDLVIGISAWCRENGASLIVFSGRSFGWPYEHEYQNTAIFSHIHSGTIDALIIVTGTQCNFISRENFRSYLDSLAPLPLLSVSIPLQGVSSILADNDIGLRHLISHLIIVHKCRRIAVLKGPADNDEAVNRFGVYLTTLKEHGITPEPELEFQGDFSLENSLVPLRQYFQKRYDKNPDFDALVCLNDTMAVGVLQYFKEQGIQVPEDVIVSGFDDIHRARYEQPTLSTVSQDIVQQGRLAAEQAAALIKGNTIPPLTIFKTRAIYRQSCGCVPKEATDYIAINENGEKVPTSSDFYTEPGFQWFRLQDDLLQLRMYFSRIVSLLSMNDLIEDLVRNFKHFRIRSCGLVLFEHGIRLQRGQFFKLPEKAELVLHYDDDTTENKKTERICFNPQKTILPPGLFTSRNRTLVAISLYHRETQLGYLVYEEGDCDAVVYETLCVQLSATLWSALVFTEKQAMEDRLSEALSDLEQSNKKLNTISRTDDLTGLYNRRGFILLGQKKIDNAIRNHKTGLVVFADMDGLKMINDNWGHDAGDRAIIAMGRVLAQAFRDNDIIARLGGDEFAVIAVNTDNSLVKTLRDRIQSLVQKYNEGSKEEFLLSLSLGAIEFHVDGSSDLESLLSSADSVLYEEKRAKRAKRAADALKASSSRRHS